MKSWILVISLLLNLLLLGGLIFLNDRYGLWAKVQRVALVEWRVPGIVPRHEVNRNYQVRREMFRLDRNTAARVLMLGDSLTAQGEWNAMLGKPLVANRGIDGDTSAGVLARIGDDADFRGDAVVIWIGTNDVLQEHAARPVVEGIIEAARRKAKILKLEKLKSKNLITDYSDRHNQAPGQVRGRLPQGSPEGETSGNERIKWGTTKDTNSYEVGKIIDGKIIRTTESTEDTEEESGQRLAGQAGAAFSNPSTSKLARDRENTSLTRSASSPASSPAPAPQAQVFVLGIPPIARWWEGARERNGTIREINAALAANATAEGYAFVDLHPVLADENRFLRGEMTSDGVHLSAKGYEAVLEKLKESGLF